MSSCTRPGCTGTVSQTGFCDTCGRKPLAPPPSSSVARGPRSLTGTIAQASGEPSRGSGVSGGSTARTSGDGQWISAGLVSLPLLELPDPASRILTDPKVPERSRICGKDGCDAEVGRSYAGQPALTEGYCPRCSTPFSFTPKLRAGDLVAGQYEVVGCLDRGGMGWVYLAKDTHLDDNYVALKGLINTNDAQALALAVSERRFLTALDHPNIVRIFNFVTHPDPHSGEQTGYIVMEYVGGLSLSEVKAMAMRQQDPLGGRLLVEYIIAYGREILAALEYLHSQGLLYCDMKPSNVIRSKNRVKIIDLGAVRRIDDRQAPIVGTVGYQVDSREISTRGLSVQSDIRTVGKTLEELFGVCADRLAEHDGGPGNSRLGFGLESFRQVLERATQEEADRRFPSAAAMSEQLRGVLREILALRDGRPRPEPSTVFTVTAALLDGGLGMVPALVRWTATPAVETAQRRDVLGAGRPTTSAVAVGLPVPHVDADDPAAGFLATVTETASRRLVDKLSAFQKESVEIQLYGCRVHIELADIEEARGCLDRAQKMLGAAAAHDWRIAWHLGLLALAEGSVAEAELNFTEVYRALPGEDAPKLALGFCYEYLGKLEQAQRCYESVWRRDRSQAGAAFGLARICLNRADRAGAVTILDEVPEVSRHYDAAQIAAVRIHAGRLERGTGAGNGLPAAADFSEVVRRLPALYLDGGNEDGDSRDRLTAAVRETALAWVLETEDHEQVDGGEILGSRLSERELRLRLEQSFRNLARQARSVDDHGVLIDLANAVRPDTVR